MVLIDSNTNIGICVIDIWICSLSDEYVREVLNLPSSLPGFVFGATHGVRLSVMTWRMCPLPLSPNPNSPTPPPVV